MSDTMNHYDSQAENRRPWTIAEDQKVVELVNRYDTKNWSVVANELSTNRTGKQCRERWVNHLSPEVRKEEWSPAEDQILINQHKIYGSSWSVIAKFLPGRPDNAIKNRWNSTRRRVSRALSENKHRVSQSLEQYDDNKVKKTGLLYEYCLQFIDDNGSLITNNGSSTSKKKEHVSSSSKKKPSSSKKKEHVSSSKKKEHVSSSKKKQRVDGDKQIFQPDHYEQRLQFKMPTLSQAITQYSSVSDIEPSHDKGYKEQYTSQQLSLMYQIYTSKLKLVGITSFPSSIPPSKVFEILNKYYNVNQNEVDHSDQNKSTQSTRKHYKRQRDQVDSSESESESEDSESEEQEDCNFKRQVYIETETQTGQSQYVVVPSSPLVNNSPGSLSLITDNHFTNSSGQRMVITPPLSTNSLQTIGSSRSFDFIATSSTSNLNSPQTSRLPYFDYDLSTSNIMNNQTFFSQQNSSSQDIIQVNEHSSIGRLEINVQSVQSSSLNVDTKSSLGMDDYSWQMSPSMSNYSINHLPPPIHSFNSRSVFSPRSQPSFFTSPSLSNYFKSTSQIEAS